MMPRRALVADDEPLAREALAKVIAETAEWTVAATCGDGREARARLEADPTIELAFLDIHMPPPTGLELAAWIAAVERPCGIVFVTSFSQHAVDAFESGAIDYVLKPFRPDRIRQALARAAERRSIESVEEVARWVRTIAPPEASPYLAFLTSTSAGRTTVVPVGDVVAFTTEDNYVRAHIDGGSLLVRGPLTQLLNRLDPRQFIRTHRGAAVNVRAVRAYRVRADGDYLAEMSSGLTIPVSRAFRERFLSCFG